MPGEDAGLLVVDAPLPQRLAERGHALEAALERDALGDRALGHPQPLLAVVAEAPEPEQRPGAAGVEHQGDAPEGIVPELALAGLRLEPAIDVSRIGGGLELGRPHRLAAFEVCPA